MRPRRSVALCAPLLALAAATPLAIPAQASTVGSLSIVAKGTAGTTVTGAGQFTVTGDTAVTMSVAHLSGGNATLAAGPGGTLPTAVKFPAYVASGTYPRAVIRLTPTSGTALSPGPADFEYGAVLKLNAANQGRTADNGNNAFQRGLSSDPRMFKLEVDNAHPACTVQGAAGKAVVRSTVTVTAGTWYTATCSRVAGKLTVAVTPYITDTALKVATTRATVTDSTGSVTFTSGIRASIGGKLNDTGSVDASASDQFNGAIAKVWVKRT